MQQLFAQQLCTDLGLTREFEVAIAHSIREQGAPPSAPHTTHTPPHTTAAHLCLTFGGCGAVNRHLRSYVETASADEARARVRPVVRSAVRDGEETEIFTPVVSAPANPYKVITDAYKYAHAPFLHLLFYNYLWYCYL